MSHRDRCVGRLKHQGHRLAHKNAASHHNSAFAGGINALTAQHGHHAGRGAAARAWFTLQEASKVECVQTIGVLIGIDRSQQRGFIKTRRQGQLQQNSIHPLIGIERLDGLQQGLRLRGRR